MKTSILLAILALGSFTFELNHGWQGYAEGLGGVIHILAILASLKWSWHSTEGSLGEL